MRGVAGGGRVAVVVAGALVLLAILAGCTGSGGGAAGEGGGSGGSGGTEGGFASGDAGGSAREEDLPASAAGGGEMAQAGTGAAAVGADAAGGFDRKIVKTAELGIRAEDVREAASRAQGVAADFGGAVLSSRTYNGGSSTHAELVLAVPSPDFERALEELRGLGTRVLTDTVGGQDVTEEFVDLESRERNLLAAEGSLLKLYDEAKDVEDTLAVQRELTQVRGQIEEVQGRLEFLEDRTATSRITLSVEPVPSAAKPEPGWSALAVATRAWEASLAVLQAIATALISAVVFGWWLVPALVAGLVWWRRRNRPSPPAPEAP